MPLFDDLTPAQEKIIKDICYIQLSSLRRLYNDESTSEMDMVMLLIEHEVSKEDFINEVELKMERIKKFGKKPSEINTLDEQELSTFRHILCNIENKYEDQYPRAIANLWERLFILSDFKTVEKIIKN